MTSRRGPDPPLERGYFVQPTVFADVSNDMTIARQEVFGPVLAVIPFRNEEEAVRLANHSELGSPGAGFSANPERAKAVARRMRTGQIVLNAVAKRARVLCGGKRADRVARQVERGRSTSTTSWWPPF